jgi:hypothetical protein
MKTFIFPVFYNTQSAIRNSIDTFMWQLTMDELGSVTWDFSVKNTEAPVQNATLRTISDHVLRSIFEMNI